MLILKILMEGSRNYQTCQELKDLCALEFSRNAWGKCNRAGCLKEYSLSCLSGERRNQLNLQHGIQQDIGKTFVSINDGAIMGNPMAVENPHHLLPLEQITQAFARKVKHRPNPVFVF